jgi:hypothetical protein
LISFPGESVLRKIMQYATGFRLLAHRKHR